MKEKMISTIIDELTFRKDFFDPNDRISSIYFGGGTPSVLSMQEIDKILGTVFNYYLVDKNVEITFECNPDDLDKEYLKGLKFVGVNRLSIGVQSFNDEHLKWMNRSHNANQSLKCLETAAQIGLKNISIDLIYGLPNLSDDEWYKTVNQAFNMPINHLSAYILTMEENTPYIKLVNQGKYDKPNDDISSNHYQILVQLSNEFRWEHYEVSSFCKPSNYSRHNSSYWNGKKYLGVGPSAHSFDSKIRYWNVSSNKSYLEYVPSRENFFESEELNTSNRLNENIMTGLRTKWGIDLGKLSKDYKYDISNLFHDDIKYWVSLDWVEIKDSNMRLTDEGMLFADHIASTLFMN
jgi:oxygen-independent coproporphyrinogen-3 oxidase